MALQITNATVIAKIERLAKATRLSKTAAVERAVDALLRQHPPDPKPDSRERIDAILAQIDRIPDRPDPFDPFDWGKNGLPR